MANNIFEGIWQRYPTSQTDKNFTHRGAFQPLPGQSVGTTWAYQRTVNTLQSAGAIMLASAGSSISEFTLAPIGSSGFEMLLISN